MNPIFENLLAKIAAKSKPKPLTAKKPDEDFIPYVCHYDPNTILTKNGELLQIIRITGFSNNSIASELISLRDTVRDAIMDNVKDNKVAFWFSTLRRKKDIAPEGEFTDFLSQKVDEIWVAENKWDDQYVNELYITVIVEGLDTSIVNLESFTRSFSYAATKKLHRNFLQSAHNKLTQIVKNIAKATEDYGAKVLGINEWEGILYSEPMRFFGKIVNLYEERYPLSANDISSDLASHKIAFGDRELQVLGYNNKNFAAMLSLKEYLEVSTSLLDRILQLPFEFIITQSFDFSFSRKELEHFEYQNYLLQLSGDENFRQISGVANFIESTHNSSTDYGKLQTTIMLISPTPKQLEKDVKSLLEQFNSVGLIVIREDIFSEHCFWSQLPGNFRYLRRQKLINTYRIAGFAALHNFPSGLIAGNKWGPALTVFKTVLNTPYFFNFHDHDLGHTLILGPKDSGKTVLLNFLLAQSQRFKPRVFYFDLNNKAKCFISGLSGHYYQMSQQKMNDKEFLHINPLILNKNEDNRNFLRDFFVSLIAFSKSGISQQEINLIPQVVDRIINSNATDFTAAAEMFNSPETIHIYDKLKLWNGGRLSFVFGSQQEIDWANQIMAFDLTEIFSQKPILIPVLLYLLYRIEASLDGSPAIIVLNEAWGMLDNPVLAPRINNFLDRIKQKNGVVIFVSSEVEAVGESELSKMLRKKFATEIFMPNPQADESYEAAFGLTAEEAEIVKVMNKEEHHFLFKHAEDSVIATLDLTNHVELVKIFSADEITLAAMEEVIASTNAEAGQHPDEKVWLPQLFEVIKALENDRIEEERRLLRDAAAEKRRARNKGDEK